MTDPIPPDSNVCRVVEARVEPSEVGYLNMLFESYEGLAILRVLDPKMGVVQFWTSPSRLAELEDCLVALAAETPRLDILDRFEWSVERAR